jgi:hypothetical protein
MCKSTDLIKQDDVFVCQNCGRRYSVDKMKNMIEPMKQVNSKLSALWCIVIINLIATIFLIVEIISWIRFRNGMREVGEGLSKMFGG